VIVKNIYNTSNNLILFMNLLRDWLLCLKPRCGTLWIGVFRSRINLLSCLRNVCSLLMQMSFSFVLLTLLLFFTTFPLTLFSLELLLLSADLLVVLICDVLLSSEVFDSGDELLWQPLLLTGCFFLGRPFNLGAFRNLVLILIEKRKRKIHYEIWDEKAFFYYVFIFIQSML
jgi:hypothetical protein